MGDVGREKEIVRGAEGEVDLARGDAGRVVDVIGTVGAGDVVGTGIAFVTSVVGCISSDDEELLEPVVEGGSSMYDA